MPAALLDGKFSSLYALPAQHKFSNLITRRRNLSCILNMQHYECMHSSTTQFRLLFLAIFVLLLCLGIWERSTYVLRSASLSVCLSVCPRAYLWNRRTDLHEFIVQIPSGRGSVLLWRQFDTLCTSGFMNDVMFDHSGPYGDAWKAEPLTYYH